MSYWLSALPLQRIAGTAYTVRDIDINTMILSLSGSAVTVTLPNDLPPGFQVNFKQKGAGQITFVAASGATLESRNNEYKTAGQKAIVSLFVEDNQGGAAIWNLVGDKAA